jgi:1-phosphatidylinositol-4-phosphate 5-kinase
MHGVNEFDFLLSVCGNANFIEFVSNAKSGQFFFYSSDGKYMIKTMTNAESKFLRRILPHYFKHCCENPNTMITRFFGMYRVKLYHLRRNVKFVIMNSVYYTDKILHTFYDLKGSVVGRSAKPGQAVLKDNDLRDGLPDDALALPPEQRANVRKQLVSDCAFLNRMGIMDYSMLVGVHYIPAFDDRSERVVKTHRRKPSLKTESLPARLEGPADSPRRKILSKSDQPRSQGESACTALVFEDGLDDDDSSYLVGSESRPNHQHTSFNEDTERKKLVTVEKLYWPFHHFFDIHGYRRMHPARCPTCNDTECKCSREDSKAVDGYKVPKFVAPLSDRKDGGFVMDTTGLQLPIVWKGPTGEQQCEGKIFYMGIIDILQEYNSRKSLESKYRRLRSSKMQASCVPPKNYGERFIDFFDEYTRRDLGGASEDEGVEVSVRNDES